MSLVFNKVVKDGDASKEYILLKATETINIGQYAIIDRTFDEEGKVSNIDRHYFRFPVKTVKKGEYAVLRTGKGAYSLGTLKDGITPLHNFYRNSAAPVLNDDEIEKLELLKVETVDTKVLNEKKVKFNFRPTNLKYGGK